MNCPFHAKSQTTCPNQQVCPNDDPNFTKLLKDTGIIEKGTPEERSNLFYICVLARTLLYSGVYVYRDAPWMPFLVGIFAAASIFQLARPCPKTGHCPGTQWWSKKFQLVMAILILLSTIAVKFGKVDSRSMAILLFISLTGGVLQRTQVDMC